MKRIYAAGVVGAVVGVLAAATVLLAYLQVAQRGSLLHASPAESALNLLFATALLAGPGAILLGIPLAVWIRRRARDRGQLRAATLAFGTLAGIPFGLANYALVTYLVLPLLTPDRLPFGVGILAAAAGGVGLGFGGAWYLTLPPKESS